MSSPRLPRTVNICGKLPNTPRSTLTGWFRRSLPPLVLFSPRNKKKTVLQLLIWVLPLLLSPSTRKAIFSMSVLSLPVLIILLTTSLFSSLSIQKWPKKSKPALSLVISTVKNLPSSKSAQKKAKSNAISIAKKLMP